MLSDVARRVSAPEITPTAADDPPEIGGYEIRGRLGQGGMGVVYLGATRSGRLLAIKVIHPERTGENEFRTRFRREVSAATRVRSRRTAAVVDFDVDAATPWLATEHVPGPTLAHAIAELGSLPEEAVRELVLGLTEALDAIHREGLVHRDVKPTNVLLGPDGPVLIDLGVVADSDATSLTTTGAQPGTPQFMSPEQARGEAVTTATDVWSLGAVTHLAASGTPPFGTGSLASVTYRIVHEPPALDVVPAGLRGLVAACLAKDPAARPTTAAVLASLADLPYVEPEVTGLTSARLTGADTVLGTGSEPARGPAAPVAAPDLPEESPPGRVRRRVLTGLVALGLVLAGGGAAAALAHFLGPDDTPGTVGTPRADGSAPAEPSATPSPSPSATEPSSKPSPSPSAPAATPVDEQEAEPAEEQAAPARFRPGTVSIPASVQVGQKIIARATGWSPEPSGTTCVWSIGGEERDNLGSCSYTVALGDVGKPVQVRLTATRSGYAEAAVLSDATGTVPQPTVPQPQCSIRMDPGKVNSGWMTYCEVDQDPNVTYTWSWVDVTRDETIRWADYPPGRRIWIGGGRAGNQGRVTVTAERDGYRSAEFGTNFTLPDEWVPAGQ
ncbi:serine/threonine-protein kinase [Promicromonospora kroppenstedtii]|uniref:Serine/threonine-protein kinase n=1 Tax=Promicromonospora kroppenstedtii TaxID=440482 RepID=A0ABW7XPG2_9MICO